MDVAAVGGLVGVGITILLVMKLSGSLLMFWDFMSLLIVVIGSAFSTLIRWSIPEFVGAIKSAVGVLLNQNYDAFTLVQEILELTKVARKESILALEKVPVKYDFLEKAVKYMVDGYAEDAIETMLLLEISVAKKRTKDAADIYDNLAEGAPAFGMIGTVIGLIVIMANLSDPDAIGPGLAVALVTTLYGSLIANAFFIPFCQKIKYRGDEKVVNMMLVREGVKGILNGDNPRVIEIRLNTFIE